MTDYLIVIGHVSRYVEVAAKETTKSRKVKRALSSVFASHGTPEEVRSDNCSECDTAHFSRFSKEWGFKHTTIRPDFAIKIGKTKVD